MQGYLKNNKTFPNFHLTKSINIEVGRALSQLGYKPHKTNTCQMYYIERLGLQKEL